MVAVPPSMPVAPLATGSLAILSCPPPLCPHVEFAVADVLGCPVSLSWVAQTAHPGTLYAAGEWRGRPGTSDRLAARLRGCGPVRFEVTESASAGCDAQRYSYTPELGLFRASLAANGDVTVSENQLRALLATRRVGASAQESLAHELHRLLGTAWDDELEPLRQGGDGAPVTWLRRTG